MNRSTLYGVPDAAELVLVDDAAVVDDALLLALALELAELLELLELLELPQADTASAAISAAGMARRRPARLKLGTTNLLLLLTLGAGDTSAPTAFSQKR